MCGPVGLCGVCGRIKAQGPKKNEHFFEKEAERHPDSCVELSASALNLAPYLILD